jgi:hypothetical protein
MAMLDALRIGNAIESDLDSRKAELAAGTKGNPGA